MKTLLIISKGPDERESNSPQEQVLHTGEKEQSLFHRTSMEQNLRVGKISKTFHLTPAPKGGVPSTTFLLTSA